MNLTDELRVVSRVFSATEANELVLRALTAINSNSVRSRRPISSSGTGQRQGIVLWRDENFVRVFNIIQCTEF